MLKYEREKADARYTAMEGRYKGAYTSGIFSRIYHALKVIAGIQPKEK